MSLFISFAWSRPSGQSGFSDLIASGVGAVPTKAQIEEIREIASSTRDGAAVTILWWQEIEE